MGFIFVMPLVNSTLVDVSYPNLGAIQPQVQLKTLKLIEYENELPLPQSIEIKVSETCTERESWSESTSLEFALTTTVNASIPIINWGMKSSFSLTTSVTGTYARKNTNENTETIKFPILVPTKSKVRATVTMGECDLNIDYVGRIVMETTDGVELSFPVRGTYEGVTQTDISVSLVLVKKPRKWRKFIG